MKKFISIAALFCIVFCFVNQETLAQTTITSSSTPKAGEDIFFCGSNGSINITPTGRNFNWDFSKVIPQLQDTYKFVSSQSISIVYATSFLGDIALDLKNPSVNGMYAFFKTSIKDFRQEGIGLTNPLTGIPTPIIYTSPDIIYRFPLDSDSKDSCSYGIQTKITGLPVSITGKRINTVDGWGKIITPYKTYNCLRIKSVVTEVDTFAFYTTNSSRIEYKWVSASEHIPVFEVIVIINPTLDTAMSFHYRDSYHNIMDPAGPQIEFDVKDTNAFVKDTVQFNDKSIGLTNWKWSILPTTFSFVPGNNSSSQNPKIIFNAPGIYSVSLKSTASTITNTLLRHNYINVTQNTGVPENEPVSNALHIYPIPSNGMVSIELPKFDPAQNCSINIVNISGEVVYTSIVPQSGHIHLKNLNFTPGLYFIKVQTRTNLFIENVIFD